MRLINNDPIIQLTYLGLIIYAKSLKLFKLLVKPRKI